jgi:CheY-like chemotaxis protein
MKDLRADDIHILIVEDDEIDVEAVRRNFKKGNIGNPVYHATCGVDALEYLRGENGREKISQPCVMLIDINMPQMNGFEFLSTVKNDPKLRRNIAFILTTSARDADIEKAYELNAAGYFLKANLDKLTNLLGFYRDINRFPLTQSCC